jgi:hypothetical protein
LTIRGSSGGHVVHIPPGVTVSIADLAFLGDDKGCPMQAPFCRSLIYNEGTLTLMNSTISGNTADNGGGIFNNGGTLTLSGSTVSGNTAFQDGGGIDNSSVGLIVTNSTIANNKAVRGGGIAIVSSFNPAVQATLTSCTLYHNTATTGADIGIFDQSLQQISSVTLRNSIVAGPTGPDMQGRFISKGYNLFLANSGATFDPKTQAQHATDKMVTVQDLSKVFVTTPAQLSQHGGPTITLALLPGPSSNPAVDKIPLDACQVDDGTGHKITTDQRGMARPDDGEQMCDIGAYES